MKKKSLRKYLVAIGIGSNISPRREYIKKAAEMLEKSIDCCRLSKVIETKPAEGVKGGAFYNAVLCGETLLSPERLLERTSAIETTLGRASNHPRGEARTIDLDILIYGDRILSLPGLTIPHPKMHLRIFVLKGMTELLPNEKHPVFKKSFSTLLSLLQENTNGYHRRHRRDEEKSTGREKKS
jgi:2-amino-4-hydroxy-6-hydroxymethyldihydropteridine diphosphokinase